jgi:hypothetical protein
MPHYRAEALPLNAESDDEINGEVELSFLPRPQVLADMGIAPEDFEAALLLALEGREALAARDEVDDDDIPPLEEMSLSIGGKSFKLGDLADIEIRDEVP